MASPAETPLRLLSSARAPGPTFAAEPEPEPEPDRLTASALERILGRPPAGVLSFGAAGARLSFDPSLPGAPLALGGAKPEDYRRYHAYNCRTLPDAVRHLFELFLTLVGPVPTPAQLGPCAAAAVASFQEAGLRRPLAETFFFSIGAAYWKSPLQRSAAALAVQALPPQPRGRAYYLDLRRFNGELVAPVTVRLFDSERAFQALLASRPPAA